MSTDWDKELAKIDKQLNSISDEELMKPTPPVKGGGGGAPGAKTPAAVGIAPPRPSKRQIFELVARLALAVGLGVGLLFWPYPARCGSGLLIYIGALGITLGAGVWSAVASWRHRAAKTHVLSLVVVLWALGLGAREILPRVGYARPDLGYPATWMCP